MTAPVSWRAATKRAPPAWSALARWKFPLPTRPKKSRTPSCARARPTASEARIAPLPLDEREHARWASRTMHDGQRPGDHDGPDWWQLGEVGELGEAVLAGAEQIGMARKGGVKAMGLAGVGADGLYTDTDDRRLCGQPTGALDRDAWRVRPGRIGVQKPLLIARSRVPARAEEKPARSEERRVGKECRSR